jgi:Glycosyl hydrolases family 38 N-terminal domain/Alpha mannosidase middle domain/Glycosyl hydrolases family 38 C-terminal domain
MTSNSYISNIVRGSDKKNDDAARSGGTRQRSRSNSTDGSSDADGGMNINVTRMKTSAKHVNIGASPRSSSSGGAGMARLRRRVRGGSTNKKKKPVSPGVFKLFVIGGSFLIFFLWRLASLIQLLEDPSYAMDSSSSLADLPDNNATLNGGASTTAKRHPFWESLRERRRNAFTRLVGSSNTIHHDGREEQDNKAAVQAAAKEKFLLAQQQQQQEQHQPAQQQQHQHHHPAPPAAAGLAGVVAVDRGQEEEVKKKTLSYYESNSTSSNLVDMRQLSYELPFDNPNGGSWKQGWEVEPLSPVDESHPLQIFVVPHSHCDPGWIKTFDDYFKSQTTKIITTVVNALAKDKRRKFIWAEISYFQWWWTDQGPEQRQLALDLLASGQLEFVTGGWVQPDEANSELYAMEIQLQEGHDWINQTVGAQYIPKYAWSIDPFGYSPTMAWLLKKYGFHAMLIQRVHYAVKKELAKRKHLEFYWRQVWDTTGEHDIFTHVMPFYSYDAPHSCGPDPSVCCQFDFARYPVGHAPNVNCPWGKPPQAITETNVVERALLLLDQYKKKANLYRGRVVLAPLGDDFRYQTAQEAEDQFNNYQKIFDYINDNVPGVQIQFGTLSEYFKAAMVGSFEPPLLKGSFFTYSDVNQDYWSGYFTSRVFDKALDRQLERVLFAATQMGATKEELKEPRRALSLFQHHDGVAGTAKDHVVEDYARRIHEAISFTQEWLVTRMKALDPHLVQPTEDIKACWQSGAPRDIKQNLCGDDGTAVIVYNPLDTPQTCGDIVIPGQKFQVAELPCETPGNKADSSPTSIVFDPTTGLMLEPIKEEWMVWRVTRGGAYLFVPGKLVPYDLKQNHVRVEHDGYVVMTDDWKRTVVEKEVPTEFGATATVVDFVFETNLTADNEEWIVRFSGNIKNGGVFHTDLNGFNFDTHHFRADMPIQSQVFPMPTLASIEDMSSRLTVLSEHAQGTASLQDGSIDLWLDRRLRQDDARGLNQGIRDNRPTRSRLRLLLEHDGYDSANEFNVTQVGWRMWNELQHPLEMFGHLQHPITPMPAVVAAKHLVRVRPPPKAPVVEVKNEDRAITNATIDMRQLNREMAFDNPDGGAWKQGWDVQPVEVDETHPLKIFVLPHSQYVIFNGRLRCALISFGLLTLPFCF